MSRFEQRVVSQREGVGGDRLRIFELEVVGDELL